MRMGRLFSENHAMSEDVPPYGTRELVCSMCGKTFEPNPLEAESLAELELTFGLKPNPMTAVCEDCGGRSIQ